MFSILKNANSYSHRTYSASINDCVLFILINRLAFALLCPLVRSSHRYTNLESSNESLFLGLFFFFFAFTWRLLRLKQLTVRSVIVGKSTTSTIVLVPIRLRSRLLVLPATILSFGTSGRVVPSNLISRFVAPAIVLSHYAFSTLVNCVLAMRSCYSHAIIIVAQANGATIFPNTLFLSHFRFREWVSVCVCVGVWLLVLPSIRSLSLRSYSSLLHLSFSFALFTLCGLVHLFIPHHHRLPQPP